MKRDWIGDVILIGIFLFVFLLVFGLGWTCGLNYQESRGIAYSEELIPGDYLMQQKARIPERGVIITAADPLTMPVWKCGNCGSWMIGKPFPKRRGEFEPCKS